MPELKVPTEVEEKIVNPKLGLTRNDPLIVRFRQATEITNIRRQELLSSPVRRVWGQEEGEPYYEEVDMPVYGKRKAVDVYLTMAHCNLTWPGTKDLVFSGQEKSFNEWLLEKWGKVDPLWAEEIYSICLKVNPAWGGTPASEPTKDSDLTEGEEEAGEPAE